MCLPYCLTLIVWLKPVECTFVSQQRNEGVRNTKPPTMRVVWHAVIQKNHLFFRYNEVVQANL